MSASELRASARKALTGKWGKVALITLIYALLMIGVIIIPVVGLIAIIIITPPISYGRKVSFMKLKRGEDVTYTGFLEYGFSNFGKVWKVCGRVYLKLWGPFIIGFISAVLLLFYFTAGFFAIPLSGGSEFVIELILERLSKAFIGIMVSIIWLTIKGMLYSLSFYILYDNPNMTSKEIIAESKRLMKGNRIRYLWLNITFMGWLWLSSFTFGIGMLWLIPYMSISRICFYEALIGKASKDEVIETENIDPIQ